MLSDTPAHTPRALILVGHSVTGDKIDFGLRRGGERMRSRRRQ
ncbi:unnamed protein product [Diplocarpon coronariae]